VEIIILKKKFLISHRLPGSALQWARRFSSTILKKLNSGDQGKSRLTTDGKITVFYWRKKGRANFLFPGRFEGKGVGG